MAVVMPLLSLQKELVAAMVLLKEIRDEARKTRELLKKQRGLRG